MTNVVKLVFSGFISMFTILSYGQTNGDLATLFDKHIYTEHKTSIAPEQFKNYSALLAAELLKSGKVLDTPQYLILVDRAIKSQLGMIVWHDSTGDTLIGTAKVSTGTYNRKGYYITPTGVFQHIPENHDFRAKGTINSHGIRGYGSKGMRVFDFGWQPSVRGWGTGSDKSANIRLAMHATDPNVLESKLGTPASKGCVRIPSTFNTFVDHYGLIDAAYYAKDQSSWLLTHKNPPVPGAGTYMVVVDSSVAIK